MLILAFTTSTDHGSVAVCRDGKILGSTQWTRTAHGSEMLTQKIKDLLSKLKIKPERLDALAVDRGPGSFTGCRIAAGVAKTLAFSLNLPVAAVPSLDILASGAPAATAHKGKILAVLDAHRSLLFSRWFHANSLVTAEGPIQALDTATLASQIGPETLVVGDIPPEPLEEFLKRGAKRPKKELLHFPRAKVLAQMACDLAPETFQTWREVEPIYIRAPDAVELFEKSRPRLNTAPTEPDRGGQ